MEHKAIVILSPGFEEIEAITAIDILRRAKVDVVTVSLEENAAVSGSHGIVVMADRTLSEIHADAYTCLVLPGGLRGVENMLASAALGGLVDEMAARGCVLAAVCAAPLILDSHSLLEAGAFTCHPCVHGRLRTASVLDVPTHTSGRVVTGRSAGCAMPWALALVERLLGCLPDGLAAGLRLP